MYLKNQRANVTIELLTFFLIISLTIWISIGIFELFQQKNNLNKISYLAASQIAFDNNKIQPWQNQQFLIQLAQDNNLIDLKVVVKCSSASCNNGDLITVTASGTAKNSIIKLNLQSQITATSNKYSDDK
jgi:hypothetical protein